MKRAELLAALRRELGDEAVEEHAPVEIDGVQVDVTLRPSDADAVARALACLGGFGAAAIVRGGGSQLAFGNPPRRADVLLATDRLNALEVFEPGEGVCRVQAGHRVSDLRRRVRGEAWELPLDPPHPDATVGGTVASAAVGPRCLGFGPTRDAVLGLDVALASGERTKCGGRVVKNVSGYDMAKLYTGSLGTLGVVTAAWLRLAPLPARVQSVAWSRPVSEDPFAAALTAARAPSARAASLHLPAGSGDTARVTVELAGEIAVVDRDAAALADALGACDADPDAMDEVCRLQRELGGAGGLRFRIGALPSSQRDLATELHAAGASILCHPGLRLVYAGFALPDGPDRDAVRAAFAAVERALADRPGAAVCESAPAAAKPDHDVHGDVAQWQPLFAALKQRFDPCGVLNPGRFAGRL